MLSDFKAIGVPSAAVKVDVTHRAGLEPALNMVDSELGGRDILVNNAGNVPLSGGVLQKHFKDWDSVIETQLNAGSCFRRPFGSWLVPSYSAAKKRSFN